MLDTLCFTTETRKENKEPGRAKRKLRHEGTWQAWHEGEGTGRERSILRTLLVPVEPPQGAPVSPVLYSTYPNGCLMPSILVSLMSHQDATFRKDALQ